ncbi:hypothetical protein PF011_g26580 [Phytophthora fragariae]|uniref:Uncharacterized protein n=1 Tax=Phytophthora fragariae TaxID=53985 RepID=A0A6A3HK42_9STRA|nr:hypothetical protein PF011_g26580 [Phytophthora fragariae]
MRGAWHRRHVTRKTDRGGKGRNEAHGGEDGVRLVAAEEEGVWQAEEEDGRGRRTT